MLPLKTPLLVLSTVFAATLPGVAGAAGGYLQVSGGVQALIGGASDGYADTAPAAFSGQTVSGHAIVSGTGASGAGAGHANTSGIAAAGSSATFGTLTEDSSAGCSGYGCYALGSAGGRIAYALDTFIVHGSGAITVTLHTFLQGRTSLSHDDGGATLVAASAGLSPWARFDPSQVAYASYSYSGISSFLDPRAVSITASDGEGFYVEASANQNAYVQGLSFADLEAERTISAGTSARLDYWIELSPGATLSSASGYDYRAPVPEPSQAALLGAGLALLLARRRRA